MTSIDKKQVFDRIKSMKVFIKKWWLLEHLDERILLHSSSDRKVLLSQKFFIEGDKDWPGLVCNAPGIFSIFPGGRKLERIRNIEELKNTADFKKRMREYNDIFDVCVEEGYIKMQEVKIPLKGLEGLEDRGIYSKVKMPSTATSKYYHIKGCFGLLQGLLEEYNYAWTVILIPLFVGIYGSAIFKSVVGLLRNLVLTFL